MLNQDISRHYFDALILGSGIAGLLCAHLLSEQGLSVLVACKGRLEQSNTSMAQGGLAAVTGVNALDSLELHLKDTLAAGAGLTNQQVAREILSRGSDLIALLNKLSVQFDLRHGVFDLALEGGHSHSRILHSKDSSGKTIASALINNLRTRADVALLENAFALDLIVTDGICTGAELLLDGAVVPVFARRTIIATGGAGQLFSRTTNPAVATGDGIAMAYRAGARLADLEFIQFHPTALCLPNTPAHLVSEAVRGAGAILLDANGERFAFRFHKDGELATRDLVARAIHTVCTEQNIAAVQLDLRPIGSNKIARLFPSILKTCLIAGIDPRLSPVPVAPAAHYLMGGIEADTSGNTSIAGLSAIGECASTGLHGANRLASNSLLEAGVMALNLAESLSGASSAVKIRPRSHKTSNLGRAAANNYSFVDNLPARMSASVGLERSADKLQALLGLFPSNNQIVLAAPPDRNLAEQQNMQLLSYLMTKCALERKESRGAHYRRDYPLGNPSYLNRQYISLTGQGWKNSSVSTAQKATAHSR